MSDWLEENEIGRKMVEMLLHRAQHGPSLSGYTRRDAYLEFRAKAIHELDNERAMDAAEARAHDAAQLHYESPED
jgi:hypothetical protein